MHPKGLVKLTIDGNERFLKIGTLSSAIFCDLEKIHPTEIEHRLRNQEPYTIMHFLYAGASAYNQLNKEAVDFTVADVSEWMDMMGQEELIKAIVGSISTYEEKKVSAPPAKKQTGKMKR